MNASSSKRVLIVDDDPSIVEAIEFGLMERGYEVLVARDGSEGLMRAERDAPDLIILDIVMPRRSGLALLDAIRRSRHRNPRIIMVSANDEQRHREFAAERRVDAFISKPFDISDLLNEVDALLHVGA